MPVEQFETFLRDQMLMEEFRGLVTDGLAVSQADIEQELQWRNEKVQIEYVLVKLASPCSANRIVA